MSVYHKRPTRETFTRDRLNRPSLLDSIAGSVSLSGAINIVTGNGFHTPEALYALGATAGAMFVLGERIQTALLSRMQDDERYLEAFAEWQGANPTIYAEPEPSLLYRTYHTPGRILTDIPDELSYILTGKRVFNIPNYRGWLRYGGTRWQDMPNFQPQPQTVLCNCGCQTALTYSGIGRKPKYLNDTHRKRVQRQQLALAKQV